MACGPTCFSLAWQSAAQCVSRVMARTGGMLRPSSCPPAAQFSALDAVRRAVHHDACLAALATYPAPRCHKILRYTFKICTPFVRGGPSGPLIVEDGGSHSSVWSQQA